MNDRSTCRVRAGDDALIPYLRYGAKRGLDGRSARDGHDAAVEDRAPDLWLLTNEELATLEHICAIATRRRALIDAWEADR